MLRFFASLVILFLINACGGGAPDIIEGGVIPEQEIISKSTKPVSAVVEEGKLNVALMVPLGKQKEQVGQFLIKSAQIAIADSNNSNLNLEIFNSEMISNDPQMLLTQLKEKQIKAVIGPVYAPETDKFNDLLKGQDITILSLSNDSSLKGNELLMLGISPDSQTDIIIRYAISQRIDHFYLLLPSTKYGKMIADFASNIINEKSDTTYSIAWYSGENVDQVIEETVDSIRNQDTGNKAIFMPQGGHNLAQLNAALEKHKIKISLIGSQAWDNNNILKYSHFDKAMLLKYKLSNEKFSQNFEQLFNTKPSNLDFITYNTVLMLSNMHKDKLPLSKQNIIDNNQIFDQYSEVKFTPNGLSVYKIPVMEVHNGKFKQMESYNK
jgi:branched-chain amino acid transport system substrate-binding protein